MTKCGLKDILKYCSLQMLPGGDIRQQETMSVFHKIKLRPEVEEYLQDTFKNDEVYFKSAIQIPFIPFLWLPHFFLSFLMFELKYSGTTDIHNKTVNVFVTSCSSYPQSLMDNNYLQVGTHNTCRRESLPPLLLILHKVRWEGRLKGGVSLLFAGPTIHF